MKKKLEAGLKITLVLVLFYAMTVSAWAATTMTATFDAPTHTTAIGDCAELGRELTPEDLARVVYVLSYRKVGETEWQTIESTSNTITIPDLEYSTDYEVVVGSRWDTGTVQCVTAIVTASTKPEPPPGTCGNLQIN